MPKKNSGDINFNVTTLSADALAVGDHARATSIRTIDRQTIDEFVRLSGQVSQALDGLNVDASSKAQAQTYLAEANNAVQHADIPRAKSALERIGDALKQAGVIVKEAVDLSGPLVKLGGLVGLGLQAFL